MCSPKQLSAMSMIYWSSPKRGRTTYKIFVWSLSNYGDVNWRWIHSSMHLFPPLESSWVLLFTIQELRSNQSKVKAIQAMPNSKNLKEFRGLQGRLEYILKFISNLVGRSHPFSHLTKKGAPFEWDELYHMTFEKIKNYLSYPPVLGAPIPRNLSFCTLQLRKNP